MLTSHKITINGTLFHYKSISIHKDDLIQRSQLINQGFWEACLFGDYVSFLKFDY